MGVRLLLSHVSSDAIKVALVLSLSFLIGLEREEHKARDTRFAFGGVRTYPLIGLIGYALAFLSGPQLVPVAVGFAVVGGFMLLSYRRKLAAAETAGITSEMSALMTYIVGALVCFGHLWMATSLTVASVLLLELKSALETMATRISADEIISLTKFLLLTAVILPIVPDQDLTRFQINPFKTWIIIVAVSSVSYGSYILERALRGRGGIFVSALLGGAYSSTVTTVVLARRSKEDARPRLYAGCVLTASGVMYLRLTLLVALFGPALLPSLVWPFVGLAVVAIAVGGLLARHRGPREGAVAALQRRNPLDLGAAFVFGLLFVGVLVATRWALSHTGSRAVYSLAAIMGVADVDPFILGLTQSASGTPEHVAAVGIVIAAASNNAAKAVYALLFGERRAGVWSAALLGGLALLGLIPWLWL